MPLLVALAGPAGFVGGAVVGLTAPGLLRSDRTELVRVLAVLSAVACVAASGDPTGVAVWDGILRAGLGAGVVLLAARTRLIWWIPAAAVAAAGAAGHELATGLALGVLGVAVALGATVDRSPLAGAILSAALVQVALRLQWPERHGATAAMAALVLLPVAVSGLRRSPLRPRRALVRAGLGVAGLAVVALLAGGVAALVGAERVQAGAESLAKGMEAARQGDQAASGEALGNAGRSFSGALDVVDGPWLVPARLVPVVSQHVRALRSAARTGDDLASAGASILAAADLRTIRTEGGRVELDKVTRLRQPLASATVSLRNARDRLDNATSPWLIPPVASRLRSEIGRIERTRADAESAAEVATHLPGLLGAGEPRRYFLAIQTPSEVRGSGGIIGAFAEITASNGQLSFGRFGRDEDLNTRGTPVGRRTVPGPPDYVARYGRFRPEAIWQNVPVSPHFPSVGSAITQLYPQSGGTAVDGVVSVDPTALAALLRVLGPVTVAPWPEPITADNAERVLLFDQYLRLQGPARASFLGDVAATVARRLTEGQLPPPNQLVRALGPAVRGHHLLLYSAREAEQSLFARVGADGALPAGGADALAVVNVNAGGNKLDWFLRRSSTYRARLDPDTGQVTARLTVALRNDAPSSGIPSYVIGSARVPPDPPGTNHTYLSVFSPLALEGARLDGREVPVESEQEAGLHVFSQYVVIPAGATRTVTLDLVGRLPTGRAYRLEVRAQPLVVPETLRVEVTADGRRVVHRSDAALPFDETLR